MGNILEEIKNPIKQEMKLFEKKFRESMCSEVFLLDKITRFILKTKGKQIRPIFVFLCAKLVGEITEKTHRGAAMIELIHTATLVHDDVVDESFKRRGFFSINALWKNKIAVLVGDYLLSKSVIISTENQDFDILAVISKTIREMSEGELLQLEKSRKLDITEDIYYEIIRKKTATLIAACCEVGAISNNVNVELAQKIRDFGTYTGIAFQIKDDLFDYLKKNATGKPLGIDIKEKKLTLPFIYAMNSVKKDERKYYFNIVKNHSHETGKGNELMEFVKKSGGISYAEKVMLNYQKKALEILDDFTDNEAKKSLQLMLNYIIKRDV